MNYNEACQHEAKALWWLHQLQDGGFEFVPYRERSLIDLVSTGEGVR